MSINTAVAKLVLEAETNKTKIAQVILKNQAEELGIDAGKIREDLAVKLDVMSEAVTQGLTATGRSSSGLTGEDAGRLAAYLSSGKNIFGGSFAMLLARAMAVAEVNAKMGRIVAAPTAGSCGVLPAVLFTVGENTGAEKTEYVDALLTASGIGLVIAQRATLSGSEGGCQAEIGSAAAMAAAAAVELAGGSPRQAAAAAALALKNLLGLVCDPVAGLVEVPCVKRNAAGAAIAAMACELAMAGISSHIPVDEVIDTMMEVGRAIPCSLRETAQGGLAAAPTARLIEERLKGF